MNGLRELRQLREENTKLKRLVANLSLERHILHEIVAKSCEASGAPRAGRVGATDPPLSQRRVAGLIPVERGTLRYEHDRDPQDALQVRLCELAGSRMLYEYRGFTVLLKRAGWEMNSKRVYRLYTEKDLIVHTKDVPGSSVWRRARQAGPTIGGA